MCRSIYRTSRSTKLLRRFLILAISHGAVLGSADEAEDSGAVLVSWPTPEGRAFESARHDAGVAYIDCLLTVHRANTSVSQADARSACGDQAEAYRAYLPADDAETILDVVSTQVHNESRNQ